MFGRTFYHDTMRKYVILFGTLFNDVWINREDSNGNVKDVIKVPLSYGPREKFLARITGIEDGRDPLQQPFAAVVPRMGFEMTGFTYAAERKLPARNKFVTQAVVDDDGKKAYNFNPVPYDMTFSLSIFVKNAVDGTRIVEQILPYFKPEWVSTVQLIDSPDITLDIPLLLNNVQLDEIYEGSFEENRTLIWQLDFTMKGFFFGPTYKSDIIKLANTQIFDATLYDSAADAVNAIDTAAAKIIAQPGLTANGEATIYTSLNTVQATAVAIIEDGVVTGIQIVNPGAGYENATITIAESPTGNPASATLTVLNDQIATITVTDGGSEYVSTPTVTISTPDLESVDSANIAADDDYGIAITIQDPYPD